MGAGASTLTAGDDAGSLGPLPWAELSGPDALALVKAEDAPALSLDEYIGDSNGVGDDSGGGALARLLADAADPGTATEAAAPGPWRLLAENGGLDDAGLAAACAAGAGAAAAAAAVSALRRLVALSISGNKLTALGAQLCALATAAQPGGGLALRSLVAGGNPWAGPGALLFPPDG